MNKKYKGFTLVEMLIVMGILAVLMGIGVSVARFAIQRANNIQHQSAVDQLYQAFQSYYTDNREYPRSSLADQDLAGTDSFQEALDVNGALDVYVDAAFDGGAPTTFYYIVDETQQAPQEFLVCVAYGGLDDEAELGGYCNGNGFGILPADGLITEKVQDDFQYFSDNVIDMADWTSDWQPAEGGWQ